MLPLPDGEHLVVDLPTPGLLSYLDPDLVGVAVVDCRGRVKRSWGLANSLDNLKQGSNVRDTPLVTLVSATTDDGERGCLFLDGYRYYTAQIGAIHTGDILVLVCDAKEEQDVRADSAQNAHSSELFKRIGKALNMHQTLDELSVLVVHEISSACELAAVLLWARSSEDDRLLLRAHVGANRQATRELHELEPAIRLSCAAELVASKREALWVPNVSENLLTSQLEARFCYLQPKSMVAIPLVIGDSLLGVLELVGREGDKRFLRNKELFLTLSEHLSLALNTALMFESVERMASFDPMTGVANHRALQEFLQARLNEAERNGGKLGLLMIDVDHFRAFNEEEGHDAGDYVLKEVARQMRDTLRPYDLPARYGGEEFCAVLPGLDLAKSLDVAERLRHNMEQVEYTSANGRIRHVTASIGVASYPETASDPASLLKAADHALYNAKRAGRNRCAVYEGTYRAAEKTGHLENVRWMDQWQISEDIPVSDRLWRRLRPYAEFLSRSLMLSKNQTLILENLIKIYPSYRRLDALRDPEVLRQLELAAEFRPLLPSLMTMSERFDGGGENGLKGQKIPLLGRILAVLIALAEEKGEPLIRDSGRFDPEIVALVAEVREAA